MVSSHEKTFKEMSTTYDEVYSDPSHSTPDFTDDLRDLRDCVFPMSINLEENLQQDPTIDEKLKDEVETHRRILYWLSTPALKAPELQGMPDRIALDESTVTNQAHAGPDGSREKLSLSTEPSGK